jgi:hypothetical protein
MPKRKRPLKRYFTSDATTISRVSASVVNTIIRTGAVAVIVKQHIFQSRPSAAVRNAKFQAVRCRYEHATDDGEIVVGMIQLSPNIGCCSGSNALEQPKKTRAIAISATKLGNSSCTDKAARNMGSAAPEMPLGPHWPVFEPKADSRDLWHLT